VSSKNEVPGPSRLVVAYFLSVGSLFGSIPSMISTDNMQIPILLVSVLMLVVSAMMANLHIRRYMTKLSGKERNDAIAWLAPWLVVAFLAIILNSAAVGLVFNTRAVPPDHTKAVGSIGGILVFIILAGSYVAIFRKAIRETWNAMFASDKRHAAGRRQR